VLMPMAVAIVSLVTTTSVLKTGLSLKIHYVWLGSFPRSMLLALQKNI